MRLKLEMLLSIPTAPDGAGVYKGRRERGHLWARSFLRRRECLSPRQDARKQFRYELRGVRVGPVRIHQAQVET